MRVDRASLRVKADPARICAAFVDRDAIVCWLPPAGAKAVLDTFDPRPGGAFCMTLTFEEQRGAHGKTAANTDTLQGRFVALDPLRRIEQAFNFVSNDPRFAGTMAVTWTFVADRDATIVRVAASHVPEGIDPEVHRRAMRASLGQLADYVASS